METHGPWIGGALVFAGTALLRHSWTKGRGPKACWLIPAWLCVLAGFIALGRAWGGEIGTAYAFLAVSIAGYCLVAAGIQLRTASSRTPREAVLEPEERPTNWARGIAKSLLAIVVSGAASIGLGLTFALYMPMAAHDRIVIGGVLVPVLWGAGMAWTLSDAKLVRATVLLLVITAVCYGVAFLPKALS
jgi:hypothetical protein